MVQTTNVVYDILASKWKATVIDTSTNDVSEVEITPEEVYSRLSEINSNFPDNQQYYWEVGVETPVLKFRKQPDPS